MKHIALIDGNHMVRRAFHVMEDLTDPAGNPTGGIFGFLNSVRTTIQALAPDRVVVVFDGGSDPWRLALLPTYKDRSDKDPEKEAERKRQGAAVAWQVRELRNKLLPYLGIPFLCLPETEADDLIYVARERVISTFGIHTVVVSGDKDFYQMVRGDTSVFDPMDKKPSRPMEGPPLITSENFTKHTGMLHPRQFLDFRALIGDKSDRIPGIPGVGEVTAKAALAKFGSLRSIVAKPGQVRLMGRRFGTLIAGARVAARNLLLMGLNFRPHDPEETEAVARTILDPIPPISPDIVRAYCREKRALDFMSNLPELLQLLQAQKMRSDRLCEWIAREHRGSTVQTRRR